MHLESKCFIHVHLESLIFFTFRVTFSQIASIFTFSVDMFSTFSYLFTYSGIFTFEGATVYTNQL